MIKIRKIALFGLSFFIGLTAVAQTTVNFTSTSFSSDAMVGNGGIEQMNFGSQNQMRVYYEQTQQIGHTFRTFLKFDLSSIPTNAIITSATLKLFPQQVNNAVNHPIYIERVSGSAWSANTLNWDIQPAVTTDRLSFSHAQTSSSTLHEFNVKSHVQKMVNYPSLNQGWRIRLQQETAASTFGIVYHSSEATTSSNHPVLSVQYILPIEISTQVVHNTAGHTDATLSATLSGGSSYSLSNIYFYQSVRDTTQVGKANLVNAKLTNNVQYNSATHTITAENLAPGSYIIRVLDNQYHATSDPRTIFYKHVLVGRQGESTTCLIHPHHDYQENVHLQNDKPTNTNPLDRGNTNYSRSGVEWPLRISDVPNVYETASLIKYELDFDPQLDFSKAELFMQNHSKFFRHHNSSNAVNLSLITADWEEKTVTWNTRPSVDTTQRVYIPTTTVIGYDNVHTSDTLSLLPFVSQWQTGAPNYGFELALETYGASQYADRSYRSAQPNLNFVEFEFEVKEAVSASFDDNSNTGSIFVNAPQGHALPYKYLIAHQPLGELSTLWNFIKDSSFIDSTTFFRGNINSTNYTFENLPSGEYHIAVYDNTGTKILAGNTTVSTTIEFSNATHIEQTADNTISKTAGIQTNATGRLKGGLLADNDYGGIVFELAEIGELALGFNKTADPVVSSATDLEFGFKLESNGNYRIITNNTVGAVLGTATVGTRITLLKEYGEYVALVGNTEVYRSAVTTLDASAISIGTLLVGVGAKLKIKHFKGKLKKGPFSIKVNYPECGEVAGGITVTAESIISCTLINNDPSGPTPIGLAMDGSTAAYPSVPIGTYTLTATYTEGGYGYSIIRQVAVGYVVDWEANNNSIVSPVNTIRNAPSVPAGSYVTVGATNTTVPDEPSWVQFEPHFPTGYSDGTNPYANREDFYLKNLSGGPAMRLQLAGYGIAVLDAELDFLDAWRNNGAWRIDQNEANYKIYHNNINLFATPRTINGAATGPFKIKIGQKGNPRFVRTIASFCSNYPIPDQYVEPKRTMEGGYYLVPHDDQLRFEFNEEYVPSTATATSDDLNYVVRDFAGTTYTDVALGTLDEKFGDNRFILDVSSLSSGYYILEIKNLKGEDWFLRFEVQ